MGKCLTDIDKSRRCSIEQFCRVVTSWRPVVCERSREYCGLKKPVYCLDLNYRQEISDMFHSVQRCLTLAVRTFVVSVQSIVTVCRADTLELGVFGHTTPSYGWDKKLKLIFF